VVKNILFALARKSFYLNHLRNLMH
jgi:hypothetical protein